MADPGEAQLADLPPDALWDDWDSPPRVPGTPELHLHGFDGSLDLLLDLAERERIDLGRLSVVDMADQFVAAMLRYERHVTLERRAGWLVLATRLVLLRSRLMLPSTAEAGGEAQAEAEHQLARLQALQVVRAAAAWLEARPQAGRDVFTRLRRERDPRVASYMRLMEACLTILEREEERQQTDVESVYRPIITPLFRIPDALSRIRRWLAGLPEPTLLTDFLPELPEEVLDRGLVARSAVGSTFVAALELARLGELALSEETTFEEVTATSVHP